MSIRIRTLLLIPFMALFFHAGLASAQDAAAADKGRALGKQEILDLVAGKTITYKITAGARNVSSDGGQMRITFTKTEDFGGTLEAFAKGSSGGKWWVTDQGRLFRQYDRVAYGDKPFGVGVVERDGTYFWKLGNELQELLSIK